MLTTTSHSACIAEKICPLDLEINDTHFTQKQTLESLHREKPFNLIF